MSQLRPLSSFDLYLCYKTSEVLAGFSSLVFVLLKNIMDIHVKTVCFDS